jgi:hypothetical protein
MTLAAFSLSACAVFAENGQDKTSNKLPTQGAEIEITGDTAKKIYTEMTNPQRTDSYDAEGGFEVFISIGKNIVCTYATTTPEQYSCTLSLKDKTTGEVDIKQ